MHAIRLSKTLSAARGRASYKRTTVFMYSHRIFCLHERSAVPYLLAISSRVDPSTALTIGTIDGDWFRDGAQLGRKTNLGANCGDLRRRQLERMAGLKCVFPANTTRVRNIVQSWAVVRIEIPKVKHNAFGRTKVPTLFPFETELAAGRASLASTSRPRCWPASYLQQSKRGSKTSWIAKKTCAR